MLRKLNVYQKLQIVSLFWIIGSFLYGCFFQFNLAKNTPFWIRIFEYLKTWEGAVLAFFIVWILFTVFLCGTYETKSRSVRKSLFHWFKRAKANQVRALLLFIISATIFFFCLWLINYQEQHFGYAMLTLKILGILFASLAFFFLLKALDTDEEDNF